MATCFQPEILLMDESILTGDARFLGKAEARAGERLGACFHSLELTKRWCTKGLWLDQGRIKMWGPIDTVIEEYQKFVSTK